MEKIIAHLPLLSRGPIDGVTALYRPWSVVGFLEMADAPEKVASARSGRCDRQRKRMEILSKWNTSRLSGECPSAPQRDHCGSCAGADQARDVVAHARERITAAGPSLVLVVASDQVGADVADGKLGDVLGDAGDPICRCARTWT
jgi:hypothetical protein